MPSLKNSDREKVLVMPFITLIAHMVDHALGRSGLDYGFHNSREVVASVESIE